LIGLGPEDAAEVAALYETYEWWADRDPADVERALANTDLAVGIREETGDLVAAARVLTDLVYYARLYDVIVASSRREVGIGERLVAAVTDHPELQAVDAIALTCREGLVPFYDRCGFERHEPTVDVDGEPEVFLTMRYDP
jgi:predicted GNAT family N-acyltransferase